MLLEIVVSGQLDRPLAWVAISGLLVLAGWSLPQLFERLQAHFLRKTVVIIGRKQKARRIAKWLMANDPNSVVVGRFEPASGKTLPLAEPELDTLTRGAREGRCSHVVLAFEAGEQATLGALLRRLAPLALDVREGVAAIGGGGYSLVPLQGPALDRKQLILKRALDLVVAVSALIVLAPVMALIALAVKFDSPGPVIFVQPRGGYRGRTFNLFKFRTMTVMETGDDVVQARADDPRITTIGAFLRRTSLDELPQLFNVLRGELSLVGPRPHALAHDRYYGELIEQYALRQRVKPGITGWAQVSGYRGETRDPEKMRGRIEHDLTYIKNWSLGLDLRILLRTLAITLWDRKAF
jgi:exopolysaccharide biosynthesis polyprenyl glycosylphosphotransferase